MKNKKLYFIIAIIVIAILAIASYIIASEVQKSEENNNSVLEVQDGTGDEGETNDVYQPKD